MTDQEISATLDHYLLTRLAALDRSARLVCVLDPDRRLKLGPSLEVHAVPWPVLRYSGDDLAFRASFVPASPALIWITRPEHPQAASEDRLMLSSLADVLARADEIVDLSLTGVLDEFIPGETWPSAPLAAHAALFGAHLPAVVAGHQAIRRQLPRDAALDAPAIRALALHCHQPGFPADQFLFRQDSPAAVLNQYITLAWGAEWDEQGTTLLGEQARLAPRVNMGTAAAWLDVPVEGLARYLYLYRLLARARLPNVNNQLRGLGLLGFDPEPLEAHVGSALLRWERDAAWRNRVIQQAERGLTAGDIQRVVDLLNLNSTDRLLAVIGQAETPAVIYELAARLLPIAHETKSMPEAISGWASRRPSGLDAWPETAYTRQAQAITRVLDRIAFVCARLAEAQPGFASLASALDWYTGSGVYELQLAHAQAGAALWTVPDEKLRYFLQQYLSSLQGRIREYLDQADHALADLIRSDFGGYLANPRLSINVVRDAVPRRRLRPTARSSVWIVVFDGMRWDTWERVVKPRLLETFELKEQKAYLSLLPSWTHVARTGLLAGQIPSHWKGYRGTFTSQQNLLVARTLGIAESDQSSKLRFFSRMESDRTSIQLDPTRRFPYNVLIFNISDENVHHLTGGLDAVNRVVSQLLEDILAMLHSLVRLEDAVILTSDHGFTELEQDAFTTIADDRRWQRFIEGGRHPVAYRYIAGVEPPAGLTDALTFEYKGMPEGRYTVAVGRKWFQRAEARGEPARYTHGGLSFAEMVVPGAVLQRITEKRLEVSLQSLPAEVSIEEGQELRLAVTLANTGNQPAAYELSYRADTEPQPRLARGTLQPGGQASVAVTAQPIYRQTGGSTQAIQLQLAYGPPGGALAPALPRTVPVKVLPQKGKVELSLGGLDDLEP